MYTFVAEMVCVTCRDPSDSIMGTGLTTFVSLLTSEIKLKLVSPRYDVFISYSHKNTPKAQYVVEKLRRFYPGICLFFDTINLKAGV